MLCLTGLISHTAQAQPPSLGPAKAIGVDLANTPLNRPSPESKKATRIGSPKQPTAFSHRFWDCVRPAPK